MRKGSEGDRLAMTHLGYEGDRKGLLVPICVKRNVLIL